jgi:Leucine-rich repeat (LRR) protein
LQDLIQLNSPQSNFGDAASPASQALVWIGNDPHSSAKYEQEGEAATSSLLQRFALVVLFYAVNGPSWSDDRGWLNSGNECVSWNVQDLQCNSNGEISKVELNDISGSGGTIPFEIGLLTSLTVLDLARNNIGGSVPSTIGLLASMQDLRLFDNNLVGPLPTEIGQLVEMQHLATTANALTGNIPELGSMSKLTFLDLRDNQFTGELPSGLEGLSSLLFLYLFNVEVNGTLPTSLCSTLQDARIDCGELVCSCCTSASEVPCEPVRHLRQRNRN